MLLLRLSSPATAALPHLQLRIDIMGAEVGYFHHHHKGVDWVFVDHPSYPRPGGLYADEHGVYGDNQVSGLESGVLRQGPTVAVARAEAAASTWLVGWLVGACISHTSRAATSDVLLMTHLLQYKHVAGFLWCATITPVQ